MWQCFAQAGVTVFRFFASWHRFPSDVTESRGLQRPSTWQRSLSLTGPAFLRRMEFELMYKYLILVFALAIPGSAFGFASEEKALDLQNSFADQKTRIRTKLADGKSYSEISRADAAAVTEALDRIAQVLGAGDGIATLGDGSKASALQDEALINRLLSKASEDSRLVCVREKKLGSNRSTSQCSTVAQRRRNAEESQNALRSGQGNMAPSAN